MFCILKVEVLKKVDDLGILLLGLNMASTPSILAIFINQVGVLGRSIHLFFWNNNVLKCYIYMFLLLFVIHELWYPPWTKKPKLCVQSPNQCSSVCLNLLLVLVPSFWNFWKLKNVLLQVFGNFQNKIIVDFGFLKTFKQPMI